MSDIRDHRIQAILQDLGARFLRENGNNSSLITVTSVLLRGNGKYATIFFTVFPEEYQKTALEFAKRKRSEFKAYVKEHSKLGIIPMLDFEIDLGEKNRQKIDSLLNESERAHPTHRETADALEDTENDEDENIDDGVIGRDEDE